MLLKDLPDFPQRASQSQGRRNLDIGGLTFSEQCILLPHSTDGITEAGRVSY